MKSLNIFVYFACLVASITVQARKQDVSDLKIYFHNQNTDGYGILLDKDLDNFIETNFSNAKDTVFLIHGWHDNFTATINLYVGKAYVDVADVNCFVIDWSKIALKNYIEAFANVVNVGEQIAEFIVNLIDEDGLSLNKTTIVGHSLGAHIAGVAGAYLGGNAKRVIGLDPAGPLFVLENKHNRIDSSDGEFVQIIHTNAGTLGWNQELGDSDYWPNGGHHQPGCINDIEGHCAHARSVFYFAESIKTGQFYAKSCKNWETYKKGECANNTSSWMGQTNIDTYATGNFYLATNDQTPFAKG